MLSSMETISGTKMALNESYNKTEHTIVKNYLQTSGEIPDWLLCSAFVYYTCVFLFGLPGNILLLLVMRNFSMKSSTDVFMTFLYGFKLMALLAVLPVQFIKDLKVRTFLLSDISCKIHYYLVVVTFILFGVSVCHNRT